MRLNCAPKLTKWLCLLVCGVGGSAAWADTVTIDYTWTEITGWAVVGPKLVSTSTNPSPLIPGQDYVQTQTYLPDVADVDVQMSTSITYDPSSEQIVLVHTDHKESFSPFAYKQYDTYHWVSDTSEPYPNGGYWIIVGDSTYETATTQYLNTDYYWPQVVPVPLPAAAAPGALLLAGGAAVRTWRRRYSVVALRC